MSSDEESLFAKRFRLVVRLGTPPRGQVTQPLAALGFLSEKERVGHLCRRQCLPLTTPEIVVGWRLRLQHLFATPLPIEGRESESATAVGVTGDE